MSRWIKIPGGLAVMAVNKKDDVVGYGCRRPILTASDHKHHCIGPLYADSYEVAADLLQQLTRDIIEDRIWIVTT